MNDLQDTLKQCVERVGRLRQQHQRVNEQNTKVVLIEPVIAALGWDIADLGEVHREYRRRGRDNPVDYGLLLLRTPRLFIEAKGLGENLDDPRWANQTISYAAVAGVEWVALTDGAEWRVYNAHAPVPIEQKLFRAARLEQDIDAAVALLSLLSKDNMRENRIEELWKGFFVDRQVHDELLELFGDGEPAHELVNLLARRLSKLGRDEIRSSLVRARATFDFPSATVSPGTLVTVSQPRPSMPAASPAFLTDESRIPSVEPGNSGRSNRKKVTYEERRLRLGDLMAAGRLRPGATLYARYLGRQYSAELLADGAIRYAGSSYSSLSAAGEAVKILVHGAGITPSRKATDGLDFWSAEDALTGEVVTLKEIRRRVATSSECDHAGR
ncbi:hypothetical protein V6U90_26640 [Micromonospora sp. CPCC 206060]|uniref:restriction system modified-DNA reader domain-containing protein n=1 Tax=Micromonospora sp. CPCC 206060 TaxID=3122406 RepID=UPI002FEF97D3